jgi:hypothetical protein
MELYILFASIYFSITFSSAFSIRNTPHKWEVVSRIYSSVHASIASVMAILYLITLHTVPYKILLVNSTVYVVFDSVVVFVKRHDIHNDTLLWFHHLLFFFGIYYIGHIPSYMHRVARVMLVEISTIFLNHGWYIYKHNIWGFEKYIVTYLTLFTYAVFRIINLTSMLFHEYLFSLSGTYILLLTLLNYFWFYKIISKSLVSL